MSMLCSLVLEDLKNCFSELLSGLNNEKDFFLDGIFSLPQDVALLIKGVLKHLIFLKTSLGFSIH